MGDWFGGGSDTTTTQVKLPTWVDKAGQSTLNQATTTASNLAQPYSGDLYAGLAPEQQNVMQSLYGNVGSTGGAYDQAWQAAQGVANYQPQMVSGSYSPYNVSSQSLQYGYQPTPVSFQNGSYTYQPQTVQAGQQAYGYQPGAVNTQYGYTPQQVAAQQVAYGYQPQQVSAGQVEANGYTPDQITAGSFLTGDINAYMNPYTDLVEQRALDALNRSRLQSLNAVGDQSIGANAFGGSRQGIMEGVTNAESARAAGDLSAQLRAQGFDTASNLMQSDFNRSLQAQQANAANAQFGAQLAAQIGQSNYDRALQAALANQQSGLQNAQFGANVGLQNAQLGMQGQLANQQTGLQNAQFGATFGQQGQQFNEQLGLNNAQFGANLGLSNIQNALQASLANQQAGLQNAQFGSTYDYNNALQQLAAQQFNTQTGTQNAQYGAQIGMQNIANDLQSQLANQGNLYNYANLYQNANLANQQAGLQGAGLNLQGAQAMGALTAQDQATYLQQLQAAMGAADMQAAANQQDLDQQRLYYEALRNYPLEQLNIRMQALGMVPYGSTTQQTSPLNTNPLMGALGGAISGASLFGAGGALAGVGGLGGLGGAGLGGTLGLLALLSDERDKKDIQKLGKDPDSDLTIYAYRYKDAPANSPKVVGPMAQEVEKKYPGSVSEIGGHKVINLGFGG
jgi:Chaperone of endosialidase